MPCAVSCTSAILPLARLVTAPSLVGMVLEPAGVRWPDGFPAVTGALPPAPPGVVVVRPAGLPVVGAPRPLGLLVVGPACALGLPVVGPVWPEVDVPVWVPEAPAVECPAFVPAGLAAAGAAGFTAAGLVLLVVLVDEAEARIAAVKTRSATIVNARPVGCRKASRFIGFSILPRPRG